MVIGPSNLMKSVFRNKIENGLLYILAFCFGLTIVSYYLAANGKINNFPNYLSFIFLTIYLLLNFRSFWRNLDRSAIRPLMILLLFLLYLSVTTLWSSDASLSGFLLYIGYSLLLLSFILSYLICHQKLPVFRIWLPPLLILCATVSACYSIYFYYGIENYHPLVEDRLYALGRLRNPVVGAFSYSFALVVAGYYLKSAGAIAEKVIWGICSLILLYVIWLTGTRGVWIGLLSVISIHIWTIAEWNYAKKSLALAVLIAVSIAFVATIYFFGGEHLIDQRSLSFRPEIWEASLVKVWDYNILLGLGINANSELTYQHLSFQHSHSIYFATLFYGGIIGAMILVGLIITLLNHLFQTKGSLHKEIAIGTFVFGLVAFSLDGDRLLEKIDFHWIAFWFPVAMVLASGNKVSKNS